MSSENCVDDPSCDVGGDAIIMPMPSAKSPALIPSVTAPNVVTPDPLELDVPSGLVVADDESAPTSKKDPPKITPTPPRTAAVAPRPCTAPPDDCSPMV